MPGSGGTARAAAHTTPTGGVNAATTAPADGGGPSANRTGGMPSAMSGTRNFSRARSRAGSVAATVTAATNSSGSTTATSPVSSLAFVTMNPSPTYTPTPA